MKKKLLIGIGVCILLIVAGGLFLYAQLNAKLDKINYSSVSQENIKLNEGIVNDSNLTPYTNIALFGVDSRDSNSKRANSDTIIVMSIDNNRQMVNIVYVYRDPLLNVGNEEYLKCNSAYLLGGSEQAVSMLNENLDLNIDSELFSPLSSEEKKANEIVRPSVGYWANAWRRLKANKVALFSLIMIIVIIAFAIFGPIVVEKLFGFTYKSTDKTASNLWPNAQHWFGTDNLGRDLFVRVMYGARYSLIIAFAASVLNLVIGVLYGGIAGFLGGKVDNIMMRIVDVLYSIPTLIYVVLLMNVLKTEGSSGMFAIIVAMAISSWVGMARIVRGDILQLKQQEFVLAAKTLGASKTRILLRHLIPNCLGSIIVTMTLFVPSAIFTEAFLSYIGLGLNAPLASLGTLANDAKGLLTTQPYQLLFPAAMICLIILAFNLFGDGLTEALDPKHQK